MNKIPIDEIYNKGYTSYDHLIESYGLEVINDIRLGSYTGDLLFVVRNDQGQFGFLHTGYGSCSGCDALEHALSQTSDKLEQLREDLCGKIMWKEADELIDYLENKDYSLEYYGGEEEAEKIKAFINESKERILLRLLAGI